MNNWKTNSDGSGSNRSISSNRSHKNYASRSRSASRSVSVNNKYASRKSSSDRRVSRRSYSRSPSISKRKGRGNENPEPCTCIGVFGLSKRTSEQDLQNTFEKFGRIVSVKLIMDKYQNESLGYGFINYDDLDSATRAIKDGNGMTIDGKNVRVDYSITKKAHTPTPGTYKGKVSNRRNDSYNYRRDYSDRKRSRSRSHDRRGSHRRSPYGRRSPPRNSYNRYSSYNKSSYNRSPPMRNYGRSRSRSYERSSKRYH